MDQAEINNWKAIAESMEAKGDTESWFYRRARAIADGQPDPMPSVSELMGGTAALSHEWETRVREPANIPSTRAFAVLLAPDGSSPGFAWSPPRPTKA